MQVAVLCGMAVAGAGKPSGAVVFSSSSPYRGANLCVFSPSSVCSSYLSFFLPRVCLSFWSLFFSLLSTLSLVPFLSFSLPFPPLLSPIFLPFHFSAVSVFLVRVFFSLETSLPCQCPPFLCNISLRSFPPLCFFFYSFPCFFSFSSLFVFSLFFLHPPPFSLALFPRIYR